MRCCPPSGYLLTHLLGVVAVCRRRWGAGDGAAKCLSHDAAGGASPDRDVFCNSYFHCQDNHAAEKGTDDAAQRL